MQSICWCRLYIEEDSGRGNLTSVKSNLFQPASSSIEVRLVAIVERSKMHQKIRDHGCHASKPIAICPTLQLDTENIAAFLPNKSDQHGNSKQCHSGHCSENTKVVENV